MVAARFGQMKIGGSWRHALPVDADFIVYSRTRPGRSYPMVLTPEGVAVHQGEGCEGEPFNGVEGCWHSKQFSRKGDMTTAIAPYQAAPLANRIELSGDQVKVLKNTICRGASDAELQLFVYACQDLGLNPFLKQIHAVVRNVNVGSSQSPKWEKQLTIVVGIDGYRVIRDRVRDNNGVPLFEGMDGPQWSDDGREWLDFPISDQPKFARVAVWRRGVPRPYVAVARWSAYTQDNAMWKKMGAEQLAKCAEALAYRRAFPAEMGSLPTGPVGDYEPDFGNVEIPSAWTTPPAGELIDGEVIEPGSPEAPTEPDGPSASDEAVSPAPAPPAATVAQANALIKDLTETWDKDALTQLRGELDKAFPEFVAKQPGAVFAAAAPERLSEIVAWLRAKKGEPES